MLNTSLCTFFKTDVASSCPSFTSSVEEGRAVCPGEELTYNCTIDGTGSSLTVWNITLQPCPGGVVGLFHNTLGDPQIKCGPFSANLTASDGDCYTSTLTVTASPELNETVVTCKDNSENIAGSATILLSKSMPSDSNFILLYHCTRSSLPHPHPHPKLLH